MDYCMVAYTDYISDSRVRREAEALARRGFRVDVLCLRDPGRAPGSRVDGVRVYPLPVDRYRGEGRVRYLASYLRFFLLALFTLARRQITRRYRVVHVHNLPDGMVFTALIPKVLGARVILDIHDPMPEGFMVKYDLPWNHALIRLLRWMEVRSAHFADEVLCVSEQHRQVFIGHGVPASRLMVLMNLPDERIFRRNGRPGRGAGRLDLVYHGTLAGRLGIDVAIRAVDAVRREVPDVRFRVYGDGEYLPVLRDLVAERGLEGHVFLSGRFHPTAEIPDLVGSARAGIVSNRKNRITDLMMPVKLVEYVALGIPVVAPRLDTIMHYFDEDMLLYFDAGDPDDLARAILDLHHKPGSGEERARRARRFLEKHNWKDEQERLHGLVDRLLARSP